MVLLKYFGCEGNDLHVDSAEFASNRTEDTASAKFTGIVEEDAGIVIEADVGTVGTADFLLGAYDESLGNGTFLDIA